MASLAGELRNITRVFGDYARAAERYRVSLPWALARAVRLGIQGGFRPREVLFDGLLDPEITPAILAGCIGKRGLEAIQRRINVTAREVVTEDKSLFYPYCAALGLPVPAFFATWGRGAGHTADGRPLIGRAEWAHWLAEEMPAECVLKPAFGYLGEGVTLLRREGGRLHDQSGTVRDPGECFDHLAAQRKFRKWVFQERCRPHPELRAITGTDTLLSLRMVTDFHQGRAELHHCYLNVSTGSSIVDNRWDAETGNLAVYVDPDTGVLGRTYTPARDGIGIRQVERHPDTQVALAGIRLPDWDAARALAERACALFQPMRCIGWDVALTPGGPLLMEGNMWWAPSQLPGMDWSRPDPAAPMAELLRRLREAAAGPPGDIKG